MKNFAVLQRALLFVIGGAFVSQQVHANVEELTGKLTDLKGKLGELSDALSLKPAEPGSDGKQSELQKAQDEANSLIAGLDALIKQATAANAELDDAAVASLISQAQEKLNSAKILMPLKNKTTLKQIQEAVRLGTSLAKRALSKATAGSTPLAKLAKAASDLKELEMLINKANELEKDILEGDNKKEISDLITKASHAYADAENIPLDISSDAKAFAERKKSVDAGKDFAQEAIDQAPQAKKSATAKKRLKEAGKKVREQVKVAKAFKTYKAPDVPGSASEAHAMLTKLMKGLDTRIAQTTKKCDAFSGDQKIKLLASIERAEKRREYANTLLSSITQANYVEPFANVKKYIDLANNALDEIDNAIKASEKLTADENKIVNLINAIESKDESQDRKNLAAAQEEYKNAFVNYINLKAYNYFGDLVNAAIQWAVVAEATQLECKSTAPKLFGFLKGSVQKDKELLAKNYSNIVYNQQFDLVLSNMTKGQAQGLQHEIKAGTNKGLNDGIYVVTAYGKDKAPRYLMKDSAKAAATNAAEKLSALIDGKMSSLKD